VVAGAARLALVAARAAATARDDERAVVIGLGDELGAGEHAGETAAAPVAEAELDALLVGHAGAAALADDDDERVARVDREDALAVAAEPAVVVPAHPGAGEALAVAAGAPGLDVEVAHVGRHLEHLLRLGHHEVGGAALARAAVDVAAAAVAAGRPVGVALAHVADGRVARTEGEREEEGARKHVTHFTSRSKIKGQRSVPGLQKIGQTRVDNALK
jgi:hypothetical protein